MKTFVNSVSKMSAVVYCSQKFALASSDSLKTANANLTNIDV